MNFYVFSREEKDYQVVYFVVDVKHFCKVNEVDIILSYFFNKDVGAWILKWNANDIDQ